MEHDRNSDRAVMRLIFAASLAGLSYELALMRIFSISLSYHFAFMVISIAMLGIAASGTVLALFPGMKDLSRVPIYGLLLAAAIPASYLLANAVPFDPARLSWDRTAALCREPLLRHPLCSFFLFRADRIHCLCNDAARGERDLRLGPSGAGGGALAMVWLLSRGGPETSVFIIATLLLQASSIGLAGKTRCCRCC